MKTQFLITYPTLHYYALVKSDVKLMTRIEIASRPSSGWIIIVGPTQIPSYWIFIYKMAFNRQIFSTVHCGNNMASIFHSVTKKIVFLLVTEKTKLESSMPHFESMPASSLFFNTLKLWDENQYICCPLAFLFHFR